ncbi:MAG: putative ATP-dependent helicase [Frankiales bacterium]|nr:putative ATP-dependent helicase [Frankiales bacterium]
MGTEERVGRLLRAGLQAVPGAEPRPGQHAMAAAVDTALRTGEHLLVQAATGTGKSVGYLVPALASGKRVVIATATKALQAQLVDKDLPRLVAALASALGRTPTYALAKGRGNYVCLQQVHGGPGAVEDAQEGLFETSHSALAGTVLRLREWAASTDTGDRDDVPFPVGDLAWRQVSVSARDCLGGRCPDRADCFSERARETAKEADVVVANHALLALDAFTSASVLPEHAAVVLDEAHEFVSSATDALTHELSDAELRRALKAAEGLLSAGVLARVEDAQGGVEGLLATTPVGLLEGGLPAYALEVLAGVEGAFGAAAQEAGRAAEGEDELEKARRDRAKLSLAGVAETAAELRLPSVPSAVYAVPAGSSAALRVSPLSVGGALNVRLFGERTVVATSATLTVGGSFRHASRQMGLPWLGGRAVGTGEEHDPRDVAAQDEVLDGDDDRAPVRWRHLDVGSPFDHARQAQLWVADRLPDPGRMPQSWAREVDETLVELVQAAGGRTLGLFSSTAAAARAAASVRAATDLPVLLQGEDSAGALTHQFASDARTCLFGTRSFWQGVDVPGPACQLVVIDRIPFAHVDDPLVRARLADAGAHGFSDVTLPPAAVLLAQGAGRLLRGPHDRGVVAVLDPRLSTARYAGLLLATLPPFYRARDKERVLASLRAIDAAATAVVPPQARSARSAGVPVVPQGRSWSVDEDGLLKAAVEAGRTLAVLAERHEVSEDELRERVRWLGLAVPV